MPCGRFSGTGDPTLGGRAGGEGLKVGALGAEACGPMLALALSAVWPWADPLTSLSSVSLCAIEMRQYLPQYFRDQGS